MIDHIPVANPLCPTPNPMADPLGTSQGFEPAKIGNLFHGWFVFYSDVFEYGTEVSGPSLYCVRGPRVQAKGTIKAVGA